MSEAIAYHGSSIKISRFEVREAVKSAQYGPGIYFTDEGKTARTYGRFLHVCKLETGKMIDKKSRPNKTLIHKILNENITPTHLENWGYTKKEFINYWDKNIINGEPLTEILEYIWRDIFDLNDKKFCAAMVKHGIDGVIHTIQTKEKFLIVYNPRIITLESVISL